MDKEEAKRMLDELLQEAERSERCYTREEVDTHIRELMAPENFVVLTGDTHGRFERIVQFTKEIGRASCRERV